MSNGSFVARSLNRRKALALLAALSLVLSLLVQLGVGGSALPPAFGLDNLNITVDVDGPDDEPSQSDVSLLGFDDSHLPDYYVAQIQLDDTTYPGGNSGDACIFFDSDDAGGFADFAVCGSFETNATTGQVELISAALYDCKNSEPNNDEGKRCPFSGGGGDGSSGIIAQDLDGDGIFESDGNGDPLATPYDTTCSLDTTAADPFNGVGTHNTSGEQDPIFDTLLTCDVYVDELVELDGDVPAGIVVSNACSFTSPDPGSESKDCVADAGSGFLKIVKNATGGDDTFDFTVDGQPFASITTENGLGETDNIPVAGGQEFELAEVGPPAGWQLDSATCDNGDDPSALTVDAPTTVTCTFNNSVAFVPDPAFTIVKEASIDDGGSSVDEAGDVINYTITLTNTGNQGLTNVTVTDPLLGTLAGPSGDDDGDGVLDADETVDGFDSDGDGKLDTGEVWTYTGSYTVQQADLDDNGGGDGDIDNTATADTEETGPQEAMAAVPITQDADLGLVKVLLENADEDGSLTVSLGDTLTYEFVATNNGNVSLTNVTIADPLPGLSVLTCDLVQPAVLAPDEAMTCTATYVVTQSNVDAGSILNTATADSDETEPVDDSETVEVPQDADLGLVKVLLENADEDGSLTVSLGDTLTYEFVATNNGNVSLTNVTIADPLPGLSVLTCDLVQPAVLAPDEAMTCTATYVVTQSNVDAGSILNTATADSDETEPVDDSETVEVPQDADLGLVKVLLENADEDGSLTVSLGDTLTYEFVATNNGNVSLTNVTIVDPLPGLSVLTCDLVQPAVLAPDEAMTCTATYVVTQSNVDAGSILNTATADSDETEPVDDSETVEVPQDADLGLVKVLLENADEDGSLTVSLGDTLTYEFVATNNGNVSLTNVTIADPLPGLSVLTCDPVQPAVLAPDEAMTCTATYVVTQSNVDAGSILNTATADSDETEPVDDSETVEVPQDADLGLVKVLLENADEDGSLTVSLGDTLTYEFVATNNGNVSLTNVTIADPLPGLSVLTCDPVQPAVLAPDEAMTCTATYVVTQSNVDAGSILNTATADSDETEPVDDSETVEVPQDADLGLVKTFADDTVTAGGAASSFELVVTNTGDVTLTNVVVTDTVNGLLEVIGVSGTAGADNDSDGDVQTVEWLIPELGPNESATITVDFEVVAGATATAALANLVTPDTECPDGKEPNPDGVCTSTSIRPTGSCWESDGTQVIEIRNIQRTDIVVTWAYDGQGGVVTVPRRGSTFVTITGGPTTGVFSVNWARNENWWIDISDVLCNPPQEIDVTNTADVVATSAFGEVADTATDVVTVVGASGELGVPTANFTWDCNDQLVCTFTDTSTDDGTIVSWDWTFGDGNTASVQNPVHTYADAGPYDVTLVVTDDDGLTDTITYTVTVVGPPTGTMHVADLDGAPVSAGRTWNAFVTVFVVDDGGNPVDGAVVSGDWRRAGTGSCTTDSSGTCVVESFGNRLAVEVFTVTNVSFPTLTYDPGSNTDPDGDSDGTVIVVSRP